MILECPKCHLKWMERTQLPMSVEAFLARAKGFNICPLCGHKGALMLLGAKFREAWAEMTKLGVTRL
jgi:hypothetical protein